MQVAVQCKSVLLQKSLETFLGEHLETLSRCDVVLSDQNLLNQENLLRIGTDEEADIIKPFSKSQLFMKLEQFYATKNELQKVMNIAQELDAKVDTTDTVSNIGTLEEKINRLTASYVKGVLSLVKEHYEK